MDFQNRGGAKAGSAAGLADKQDINRARRERERRLGLEVIDISKDPYIMRNHLGSFECRLCLTSHPSEANYLSHTQGKKHQINLQRRMVKEERDSNVIPAPKLKMPKRRRPKIGRPGYRVLKQKDPETNQRSLLFEIEYPEILEKLEPKYRIMSCFEQRKEIPNEKYQYILFAAEPYETVGFKVPNKELDYTSGKHFEAWDKGKKKYSVQICFKNSRSAKPLPSLPKTRM